MRCLPQRVTRTRADIAGNTAGGLMVPVRAMDGDGGDRAAAR